MAKVDFPEGTFLNPVAYTAVKAESQKPKNKASIRDLKKPRFSGILERAAGETAARDEIPPEYPVSEDTLHALLDDVHSSGDLLKQRPFPGEIKRYKQAVRNFLHYVVQNSYALKEETYLFNHKKAAKVRIQVIDRKLEQLAAEILAGQTTQLELLARVDEITGMLVNLLQ
ncbi:MAG: YaaR family protein [Spirochaetaceae bacterium]|jgi:uncharacterized protein YaaR (DUF327 family)|nr:YaaR family protein [Spirochaetaceae bacterium]